MTPEWEEIEHHYAFVPGGLVWRCALGRVIWGAFPGERIELWRTDDLAGVAFPLLARPRNVGRVELTVRTRSPRPSLVYRARAGVAAWEVEGRIPYGTSGSVAAALDRVKSHLWPNGTIPEVLIDRYALGAA